MTNRAIEQIVDCPECHRICGWCSWYAKNAREGGCGSAVRRRCEWGEALRGTSCALCGGSEKVRLVGCYEPLGDAEVKSC